MPVGLTPGQSFLHGSSRFMLFKERYVSGPSVYWRWALSPQVPSVLLVSDPSIWCRFDALTVSIIGSIEFAAVSSLFALKSESTSSVADANNSVLSQRLEAILVKNDRLLLSRLWRLMASKSMSLIMYSELLRSPSSSPHSLHYAPSFWLKATHCLFSLVANWILPPAHPKKRNKHVLSVPCIIKIKYDPAHCRMGWAGRMWVIDVLSD